MTVSCALKVKQAGVVRYLLESGELVLLVIEREAGEKLCTATKEQGPCLAWAEVQARLPKETTAHK